MGEIHLKFVRCMRSTGGKYAYVPTCGISDRRTPAAMRPNFSTRPVKGRARQKVGRILRCARQRAYPNRGVAEPWKALGETQSSVGGDVRSCGKPYAKRMEPSRNRGGTVGSLKRNGWGHRGAVMELWEALGETQSSGAEPWEALCETGGIVVEPWRNHGKLLAKRKFMSTEPCGTVSGAVQFARKLHAKCSILVGG